MINLETVSYKAFAAISDIDKNFIGTADYVGVAWFWNYEYRHYLRDASTAKRRKVHNAFVSPGLPVDGVSAAHYAIIYKHFS